MVEGRTGLLGQPMAIALAAARRAGWEIVRGWPTNPAGRSVCTGPVRTPDDARRALLAAYAGAGLVVAASAERVTVHRFLADLRRLGPVEHIVEGSALAPQLSGGQRALLGLLAEGLSLREAADVLGVAPGTAKRRLAKARGSLGVDATADAIVAALAAR